MSGNATRAYWLKTLHQWHWISAALALTGILLFSITGFTLNHAAQLDGEPQQLSQKAQLPADLQAELTRLGLQFASNQIAPSLSPALQSWLLTTMQLDVSAGSAEWSEQELYISLPRPGGDAWVSINFQQGAAEHQDTDRGWIAYLNDLHKGRHTGAAWSWFIDLIAIASVLFAITGLLILKMHAANRPKTWPLVGFGLLVPVLLAILFIH